MLATTPPQPSSSTESAPGAMHWPSTEGAGRGLTSRRMFTIGTWSLRSMSLCGNFLDGRREAFGHGSPLRNTIKQPVDLVLERADAAGLFRKTSGVLSGPGASPDVIRTKNDEL